MVLAVAGLSKRYGAVWALRDVAFEAHAGEVLGVVGPNGSGKTTLFGCVAGLVPADAGTLAFLDTVLAPSQRKRALFFLPDGIAPWPAQRTRDALQLFASLHGAGGERVAELTAALKLEPLRDSPLGALSKGQRKRALLALALLTPQPVLLLDEPFDGLDLRQTRDVTALLRAEAGRGRALLVSIHQLVDAARVSDRLVLLSAGRIVGEGTLAELHAHAGLPPAAGFEEVFLALT
jgi:ABC-type multidrug transport system ATPase subunit